MKKVIFIGGIGNKKEFGGELTKNKIIINYLQSHNAKLKLVDTHNSRKRPWKLFWLPFYILCYSNYTIILSTSLDNVMWLLKIIYHFKIHRNIIYWGIGGSFPTRIRKGVINKKFLSVLKLIIVEGSSMKQILLDCGLKNVVVCPNFKNIFYLPKIERHNKIIKFVFLSRIQPEKGVDTILNTAALLNNNGYERSYSIDFYGTIYPEYYDTFHKAINVLKNIEYKGCLNLNVANGYDRLASYDSMLFLTRWEGEGFPGVVIDAYISGLPIIATDWNLNQEFIINGETGLIISNENIERNLYKVMESIILRKINLMTMAARCQKKAKLFDANYVIGNKQIYNYL